MQEGVSAMRGRGHSAFRKDASRVKRSSLTRYKAFWKRKSALDFKRSTARNRLQIRSVAVVPPRLLPYRGANQMLGGGSKISNVCAILENNSAFESSRRDLCFGAIITLKENKFEKDIFLKVFYPPKSCRFFNFCSFFRVFFCFSAHYYAAKAIPL